MAPSTEPTGLTASATVIRMTTNIQAMATIHMVGSELMRLKHVTALR